MGLFSFPVAPGGGGAEYDPKIQYKTSAFIEDEFIGGSTTLIGDLGWINNNGTPSVVLDEPDHPGVWRGATSVANQASTLSLGGSTAGGCVNPAVVGFELLMIVRANVIDAEAQYRFGAQDGNNQNPGTDAIYLERLVNDTNWFLVLRASNVQATRVDTGVVCDTNWIKAKFRRIDASTIGVSVNDGSEIISSGTAPTAHLAPFRQVFYANGGTLGNKSMDIDYFSFYTPLTR